MLVVVAVAARGDGLAESPRDRELLLIDEDNNNNQGWVDRVQEIRRRDTR